MREPTLFQAKTIYLFENQKTYSKLTYRDNKGEQQINKAEPNLDLCKCRIVSFKLQCMRTIFFLN